MNKLNEFINHIQEAVPKSIKTVTTEYAVPVEDMIKALLGKKWNTVDDEEVYDLFDDAGLGYIEKQIKNLMKEENVLGVKIDKVQFIETDSSNWSHAGAYYNVMLTGPQEELDKIVGEDKELYADTDEPEVSDDEQYKNWEPLVQAFFKKKGVLRANQKVFLSNPTQSDDKLSFHATVTDDLAGGGGTDYLVNVDLQTKKISAILERIDEVSFGNPFSGNNIDKKLEGEELLRAIRFVMAAEHEAVQLYMQIHDATTDERVKKVMKSITDEELVHFGEFEMLLHELSPNDVDLTAQGAAEAEDVMGKDKETKTEEKPKTVVTGVESEPEEEPKEDERK